MKEVLLHRLWEQRISDLRRFTTTDGSIITVKNTGSYNTGDGPDFHFANIQTNDGLSIFGDIELHIHEQDWYSHGHQKDPAYNRVILHVILHPGKKPAITQSGFRPPVLCLLPYLNASYYVLLTKTKQLPCSGGIKYINTDVIEKQLQKSLTEYFNDKTNELLKWYHTGNGFDQALKHTLLLGVANGLGIQKNRKPMEVLAENLSQVSVGVSLQDLKRRAISLSGLEKTDITPILAKNECDFSGSRPGNKPVDRINQMVEFLYRLEDLELMQVRKNPSDFWSKLTQNIPGTKNRFKLLYYTVYLPFLNLLAGLISDTSLSAFAYDSWKKQHIAPPQSILKPFQKAGLDTTKINKNLSIVHQKRHYCEPMNCHQCAIMDAIIKNTA